MALAEERAVREQVLRLELDSRLQCLLRSGNLERFGKGYTQGKLAEERSRFELHGLAQQTYCLIDVVAFQGVDAAREQRLRIADDRGRANRPW